MKIKNNFNQWSKKYDVSVFALEKHLETINLHRQYVYEIGLQFGLSKKQLDKHDISKYTEEEFPLYAKNFYDGGSDRFIYAYHHHIKHNEHHWQYWYAYGHTGNMVNNGCLAMPLHYAKEMIVDWLSANKTYGGDGNLQKWLDNHFYKIKMHENTYNFVTRMLKDMDYQL